MKIFHNPRCTKSRNALALLKSKGIEPEVVEYLKDTFTEKTLADLLQTLGIKANDLLRKNEEYYKANLKGKVLSESELVKEMIANPQLIQRPILMNNSSAIIARENDVIEKFLEG